MNEKAPYRMQFANYICKEFTAYDADTRLRKACIRSVVSKKAIHSFTLPDSKRLIDIDSFIEFFSSGNIQDTVNIIPRLRYYENCYHLLHSEYPEISVTWQQLHDIVHSGEIFVLKHGQRFIVNYDELLSKFNIK